MSEFNNENEVNNIDTGSTENVNAESANNAVEYDSSVNMSGSYFTDGEGSAPVKPKKSKAPVIIGIIVALAVIAAASFFLVRQIFSNPMDRLVSAYMNMREDRKQSMDMTVSFAIDKDSESLKDFYRLLEENDTSSSGEQIVDFLSRILPNFKLKYSAAADTESNDFKAGFQMDILYKDKSLADAGFILNGWEANLTSKTLLSKPLYLNIGKLAKEEGVNLSKLDLKPYFDILHEEDDFIKNFTKSEYVKVLKEELKDKIKAEGDKITFKLNAKESLNIYRKLIKIAANDETLKDSVLNKFDKLADIVIENKDYEIFGLSKEAAKITIKAIKSNLKVNWEDFLTELSERLLESDSMEVIEDANTETEYIFYLNGGKITKFAGTSNLNGISATVVGEYKKFDEEAVRVEKEGADDLGKILSEGSSDINSDIISNLSEKVLGGSAFGDMTDDIKKVAKETLSKEDADKITLFLDAIPVYLSYMNIFGGKSTY